MEIHEIYQNVPKDTDFGADCQIISFHVSFLIQCLGKFGQPISFTIQKLGRFCAKGIKMGTKTKLFRDIQLIPSKEGRIICGRCNERA